MSSTHGKRTGLDFYRTPRAAILPILPVLRELQGAPPPSRPHWLDAGCGDGGIMEVLREHDFSVEGIEKDPGRAFQAADRLGSQGEAPSVICGDFIQMELSLPHTSIIDNPPYNIAADWIRRCASLVDLHVHLLRLAFGTSTRSRWDLFKPGESGLRFVGALRDRPSFCISAKCSCCLGAWQFNTALATRDCLHPPGCELSGEPPRNKTPYTSSTTDSTGYAWYIWKKGYTGPAEFRPLEPSHEPAPSAGQPAFARR